MAQPLASSPPTAILSGADLLHVRTERGSSFTTGIRSIDNDAGCELSDVFCTGRIIGVAELDDDQESGAPGLTTHVIVTGLLGLEDDDDARVFILSPATADSVVGPVHDELQARLRRQPQGRGPDAALALLATRVRVLPYLDLAGLADAVADVQTSARTTAGSILLVKGVGPALAAAQRRSGPVHVAALADSLVRLLTSTSTSTLVLIELAASAGATTNGIVVESAFAGQAGQALTLHMASGNASTAGAARVLERGLDGIVVVHDGLGRAPKRRIVEVVKDRAGARLGEWAVWI